MAAARIASVMRQRRNLAGLAAAVGLAITMAAGCQRPFAAVSASPQAMTLADAASADRAFEAAAEVLRRHRFRIDRMDRRQGIITTYPETSQQFFEFWRRDVATARDWLDASVNPVRRRVEVRLPPMHRPATEPPVGEPPSTPEHAHEAGELVAGDVQISVFKERLSAPDRQFNDAGSAYQFFGYSLPATTGQAVVTPADERWLDQGRDRSFEAHLLGELARALRMNVSRLDGPAEPPPQESDVSGEPSEAGVGDHALEHNESPTSPQTPPEAAGSGR